MELPGPISKSASSVAADIATAQAAAIAAAAAAEIVADAARRDPIRSDFIQSGPIATLNGVTNFDPYSSKSGLDLTLTGAATNIVMVIAGKRAVISTAKTVTLTNNSWNFVYYDADSDALGVSVLACRYSYESPAAPASGQPWFDMNTGLMKFYSGSAWVAFNRIFLGCLRADSSVIDHANRGFDWIGLTVAERYEKFGTGADGMLDTNNTDTTIDTRKDYTFIGQRGTSSLVHTALLTSSNPMPRCQGFMMNLGTGGVNLNGLGRIAGNGGTAAGSAGAGNGFGGGGGGGGGSAASAGGSGGNITRAGQNGQDSAASGGTAGGNPGSNGAATNFPQSVGSGAASMGPLGVGGAGGGGAGDGGTAGGNGGRGAGFMDLTVAVIVLAATAIISCNGADGTAGSAAGRAGGGAGGGGRSRCRYGNLYDNNGSTFTANGGTGGASGGAGAGAGGNGGAGVFEKRRG